MATLVLKTNAAQATPVAIGDLGYELAAAGANPVTLDDAEEIRKAARSADLLRLATDDAHGAGSSTVILNDGSVDIAQADVSAFLSSLLLLGADNPFGVAKANASGQIDQTLTFDGIAQIVSAILGSDLDANNNKIVNLAAPTADNDAARKIDIEAAQQGLDTKESVRLATAAALPANTAAGSGVGKTLTGDVNGALSVDGVAVATGDRILVKDETAGADIDHGIYEVTATGDGSNPFVLTRATDFDEDDEVTANAYAFVEEGTVNSDSGWTLITDDPVTVDTTAIEFVQFTGAGAIVAGAGLTKTGNTLDVGQGAGLIVNADDIDVDFGEVGDIASLGTAAAAGVLDEAARADHVHTHGDRGVDGTISQHDADQVDVEGTFAELGTPASAEATFSAINSNFQAPKYNSHIYQLGQTEKVKANTDLYLLSGSVNTLDAPVRLLRAGRITGFSVKVDLADSTNNFDFELLINGAVVATVTLTSTNDEAGNAALDVDFAAGDDLQVRASGAAASEFKSINALVEANYVQVA